VGSFGENLRRERELRAISIQEISAATKIGTRILIALEEEDFDKLPGGIFNKGFVRAYARFVGLDEEKAIADYAEAARSRIPEQEFQVVAGQMEAARERELEAAMANGRAPGSLRAAIVALVLLGFVAAGYHWRTAFPVAVEKIKVALQGHKEPPPATTSNAQQAAASPLPVTAPAPIEPATMNPAQPDSNNASQSSTSQTATPEPAATSNPATSATAQPSAPLLTPAAEGLTLELEATEKSWVAVTIDGKKQMQATLDPENETLHSRSFKAQNRITLITGNPAGLQVTFNGKKLEPWTGPGRRMIVTFTPEGHTVQ
jgi:cytoskeleton protein RodZ